jgi:phage gp36-like protein
MPYATLQQLTDRFGERMLIGLTDRAEVPTGQIDQAVVARALADTDEEINGRVSVRYQMPLASVPPLLTDIALQIAIYKLHVFEPDPKIVRDYERALATLADIAKGVVRLDLAGVEPETQDGGGALATDRARPFEADKMTGFI